MGYFNRELKFLSDTTVDDLRTAVQMESGIPCTRECSVVATLSVDGAPISFAEGGRLVSEFGVVDGAELRADFAPLHGFLPIHQAALDANVPAVLLWVSSGVSPDVADDHGETPMMVAALNDHVAVIGALASVGASASAADGFGNTALHLAARRSRLRAVRALLAAGADPLAVNHGGYDVAEYARGRHRDAILAALAAASEGPRPPVCGAAGPGGKEEGGEEGGIAWSEAATLPAVLVA